MGSLGRYHIFKILKLVVWRSTLKILNSIREHIDALMPFRGFSFSSLGFETPMSDKLLPAKVEWLLYATRLVGPSRKTMGKEFLNLSN